MENRTNTKTIIQTTVGTIVGAVVVLLIQQYFFRAPSFDETLMQGASELNKQCPMMVDSDTQLDNAVAMPGKIFQYNYTLVNYTIDEINVEVLKDNLTPQLVNNVKTNPDMKALRDGGATIAYNYKDKNGQFLLKIEVPPALYN